ncbi:helix-turn-helix transcriptional regulator [Enterobacter kobei]|uniref:helix-turn-helix transcriptional regulator n=1 Tax=Enterobacter kobei TaxID=208224 RepID=UPI00079B6636|nr:AlpA family transcriptional regulator [Enterobacter kobei]SAF52816.1 phage transcriptional regulator%2C AlpA [Enterobacter kobei]
MHTALSVPVSPTSAHLMTVSVPTQERFLRLPEVIHQCGLSRSTLYDLIARDAFPAQVSLGGKNVAWLQSEVTAWMAERIAHRNWKCDA